MTFSRYKLVYDRLNNSMEYRRVSYGETLMSWLGKLVIGAVFLASAGIITLVFMSPFLGY